MISPVLIVLIGSIISAFGVIFIKKGADKLELKTILKNYNLFFGIFLFVAGLMVFIISLKYGDLSYLYPISSAGHVWVVLLSIPMLKESISNKKWLGIVLITIGLFLLLI